MCWIQTSVTQRFLSFWTVFYCKLIMLTEESLLSPVCFITLFGGGSHPETGVCVPFQTKRHRSFPKPNLMIFVPELNQTSPMFCA